MGDVLSSWGGATLSTILWLRDKPCSKTVNDCEETAIRCLQADIDAHPDDSIMPGVSKDLSSQTGLIILSMLKTNIFF